MSEPDMRCVTRSDLIGCNLHPRVDGQRVSGIRVPKINTKRVSKWEKGIPSADLRYELGRRVPMTEAEPRKRNTRIHSCITRPWFKVARIVKYTDDEEVETGLKHEG